jgi:alpha-beta hydrolase superfamily lysophospholipase
VWISGISHTPGRRGRNKSKFIIKTILTLVLLALVLVSVISVFTAWSLLHPADSSVQQLPADTAKYRVVNFKNNENIILNGWFFEDRDNDKTVVIAHSHGKNRLEFEDNTFDLYEGFTSRGYNVLAFDLRNAGESEGIISTHANTEKDDIAAAIKYVKQQGSNHIVLLGFSTGATASLMASAEDSSVAAVIADSPFFSFDQYIDNYLKNTKLPNFIFSKTIKKSTEILGGFNGYDISTEDFMNKLLPRNLLLIQSESDPFADAETTKKIYLDYSEVNSGTTVLWTPNSAEHASSYKENPELYMKQIDDFLSQIE